MNDYLRRAEATNMNPNPWPWAIVLVLVIGAIIYISNQGG